ncbi:GSCFA domain-containing protein [Flavobacterium franklandianum]|uniref:GSCFA domain-containing protein n=1 Tax=Flavobacterium franklandianum TaxID=2594430 RepID=A0A553CJH3_9FLAO|nr:GSCFA domain-containing protein [Flavobacterium franklandianum]TRX20648.1 GSCFA domain-containing protein [Flavobacterium franklandianum]TRX29358.1 GSCFA domain-containing protein [Flavobacterium franklandianum]
MQFRTKISILKSDYPIDYNAKIMSLGSCFAENMAEKFDYFKFENSCNPFGILFHPLAIQKFIDFAVSGKQFSDEDIFFYNERWHCFDVHSDISNSNKENFIANLNAIILSAKQQVQEASHIIITYGTSWVYRNLESNAIVANCHKVPQKEFKKELLSVETIKKSMQNTLDLIQKINPNVNFIFTVSPVRHLKDGFVENQLSKAHLITAIYKILQSEICNLQSATYFPSYEIMMDELRDYRFYAEDMIHPNSVAIDYIWQRFFETCISEESHSIMKEVETIQKGLQHRPFNPNSESHQQFLSKLHDKTVKLQNHFPQIQF